jgi:type IV pilus assembly protein PilX
MKASVQPNPFGGSRTQRGVVLFVALIVLVVMSLAGLALLRQMGSGVSIAGNVAFKENATSVADRGIEDALIWLKANAANLDSDQRALGYFSSANGVVDPTLFNWDSEVGLAPEDVVSTGNDTRFIIQRLCKVPGKSAGDISQTCSDSVKSPTGGSLEGGNYGTGNFAPPPSPYYRVTARTIGPRHTYSYVQVVIGSARF